ncbi:histidine kinase dimerization/phospho-acceptor domain-containing protein [[Clostridium] fimetarium]|uniref:histidine kinase n=1 Tax=[Clostridium] fimetarium TaxID=99656 RepID=A0A1I0R8E3_9FIRM|nr:histidine kinase dimerization/phospho-acceptor domain-containing protein [[Clostridium] fimetarium]SEW36800.1 His Kinase A (phospho-acceptor) domain-containing protein [[Clostridium] fimetarium]
MKSRFNSNVIKIVITFVLLLTIIMGLFFAKTFESANEKMRNYVVALNEIEVLTGKENSHELDEKISELQKDLLNEVDKENHSEERTFLIYLYFAAVGFVVILFSYIYFSVIRPFKKLNMFAGEISKGNMDRPLAYERNNMFGSFTWAFDSMRREIKKARAGEKEAIENNKITIATISHDIKTPVASIRAYSEALQAGMDNNIERRERYVSVIIRKCDEVSKLTNDLFLHSLADMDKLEMHLEDFSSKKLITRYYRVFRLITTGLISVLISQKLLLMLMKEDWNRCMKI